MSNTSKKSLEQSFQNLNKKNKHNLYQYINLTKNS